jgi:hypothetical protein
VLLSKIVRVFLAFFLASGILLLLDMENRHTNVKRKLQHITIFKTAMLKVIEESENGIMKALGVILSIGVLMSKKQ